MAIVLRSLYAWWFAVLAIATSPLAMAGASVGATIANPQSAAVHGTTGGGSNAAADGLPVSESGRDATADRRLGPVAGDFCFGPYTVACAVRWRPLAAAPSLDAGRVLRKSADALSGTPVRVAPHARLRVTRLQNGSILCCRERPNAHIAAMILDPNDDTASDGDESSDDDDSQDDQNGDDDTESHVIAWMPAAVLYLGAPARKATISWIFPSFSPFLTLERLRC